MSSAVGAFRAHGFGAARWNVEWLTEGREARDGRHHLRKRSSSADFERATSLKSLGL